MEEWKNRMIVCPICKKEFLPAPMHDWKINNYGLKLVCSYSCMRKYEKSQAEKEKMKKKKVKK